MEFEKKYVSSADYYICSEEFGGRIDLSPYPDAVYYPQYDNSFPRPNSISYLAEFY